MSYAENLYHSLAQKADSTQVLGMEKYMRNQFSFFGIKTPIREVVLKDFLTQNGLPKKEDLEQIIKELWQKPQREAQYIGIDLAKKFNKKWIENDLELLEYMITTKSWWDSVDAVNNLVGAFLLKFPELRSPLSEKWICSENIWLQRISLIFQLSYKKQTDFELLKKNICLLSHSDEFFIQKAIGWALRQYARHNRQAVQIFVESYPLKALSFREATKHFED